MHTLYCTILLAGRHLQLNQFGRSMERRREEMEAWQDIGSSILRRSRSRSALLGLQGEYRQTDKHTNSLEQAAPK